MTELQLPPLAAWGEGGSSAEMAGEVKLAAETVEVDADMAVLLGANNCSPCNCRGQDTQGCRCRTCMEAAHHSG